MTATSYPQWDEEIIDLYRMGFSMREIGEMINWSANFVRNRLLANDVTPRARGGSRDNRYVASAQLMKARDLYLNHAKSSVEIAKIMGVRPDTILRWLHRTGTPMRGSRNSTHCLRGHAFSPENTMIDSQGRRRCIICKRMLGRRSAAKARAKKALARVELVAG